MMTQVADTTALDAIEAKRSRIAQARQQLDAAETYIRVVRGKLDRAEQRIESLDDVEISGRKQAGLASYALDQAAAVITPDVPTAHQRLYASEDRLRRVYEALR
jgi:DNA repair exonuclease SbcCD ATPase subunit